MNIVSLTLRDCLSLSFQGIHIYLFSYYYYYYYYYFLFSFHKQKGAATTLGHI